MSRRKRPSQRRADQRAEREQRKRWRWHAEREAERLKVDPGGALVKIATESAFGVAPTGSVIPVGPAARPKAVRGPGDARFTENLNDNFKQLDTFCGATTERMNIQQEVNETLAQVVDDLNERIRCLEAAALGKPLEEIT